MPDSEPINPITTSIHDDDDMLEIIDLFIDELPDRVAIFANALEQREWDHVRTISHQLKGAAPGYGFEPIGTAAAIVEDLVLTSAALTDIETASNRLVELCSRVTKS
jgi:HPt (histidine-containing phosphotransfer) domain-containing protein